MLIYSLCFHLEFWGFLYLLNWNTRRILTWDLRWWLSGSYSQKLSTYWLSQSLCMVYLQSFWSNCIKTTFTTVMDTTVQRQSLQTRIVWVGEAVGSKDEWMFRVSSILWFIFSYWRLLKAGQFKSLNLPVSQARGISQNMVIVFGWSTFSACFSSLATWSCSTYLSVCQSTTFRKSNHKSQV